MDKDCLHISKKKNVGTFGASHPGVSQSWRHSAGTSRRELEEDRTWESMGWCQLEDKEMWASRPHPKPSQIPNPVAKMGVQSILENRCSSFPYPLPPALPPHFPVFLESPQVINTVCQAPGACKTFRFAPRINDVKKHLPGTLQSWKQKPWSIKYK